MISILRQAKNGYYDASDSSLQIGHLLLSNPVQRDFYSNSFSVSQTISIK